MTELFTPAELLTISGGTAATALVTEMLKNLPGIKKIPTRLLSIIIGIVIMESAYIIVNGFSAGGLLLQVFNGIAVAFSSNGAFDMIAKELKKDKDTKDTKEESK